MIIDKEVARSINRKLRDKDPSAGLLIKERVEKREITLQQAAYCAKAIKDTFPILYTDEDLNSFLGHTAACAEAEALKEAEKVRLAKEAEDKLQEAIETAEIRENKFLNKIQMQAAKLQAAEQRRKDREAAAAKKAEAKERNAKVKADAQALANSNNRGKTIFSISGENVASISTIIPQVSDWLRLNKSVYLAGGLLARWSDSREDVVIFNKDNFGSELDKGFAFCNLTYYRDANGDLQQDRKFFPMAPSNIISTILATEYFHGIRELDAVLSYPTVDCGGNVHGTTPGYNTNNKIMYSHEVSVESLDLDKAYRDLYEPFSEFPQCAIPGALATLFTLITRPHMTTAPMICFDAPAEGSGKSLLARVCQELVLGCRPNARSQEASDEEFDKNLKSFMQNNPGKPLFLDDFEGLIKYPVLKTLLTQPGSYSFRILGTPKDCKVRTNFAILLTGNHIELSVDLNRRCIKVNLNTNAEAPANQGGYKRSEEELEQYILDNRDHLLSCLITVLTDALKNATADDNTRPMGSFEEWARVVARSVRYACRKLMQMGILQGEVPTDVTPDFKNYIKLNDGITETFQQIYKSFGTRSWSFKTLTPEQLSLLDTALGIEGDKVNNVKRGKRLLKYTDRPRDCEEVTLVLIKESYQSWKFNVHTDKKIDTSYDYLDEAEAF